MYGFAEIVDLNPSEILKRATQAQVFSLVFGFEPEEFDVVASPFRDDKQGNCDFRFFQDTLYFCDFASSSGRRHWDCFKAVQDDYGLSFVDALKYIDKELRLGIMARKPVEAQYKAPSRLLGGVGERSVIKFQPDVWSLRTHVYWRAYEITRPQLISDQVVPVKWYTFYSVQKKKWVTIQPQGPCYAYTEFEDRTKIYSPEDERRRFISNCTKNDIGGWFDLPQSGPLLIITKSYKDWRVLRNLGLVAIWFQSENTIPDDVYLTDLISRFTEICIFYDNDSAGIKGSERLMKKLRSLKGRVKNIRFPLEPGISDPAEVVLNKGSRSLRSFIKTKVTWKFLRSSTDPGTPF